MSNLLTSLHRLSRVMLWIGGILILTGNVATQSLLNQTGITKLRGQWQNWQGRWVMPMFHPAFVLRDPSRKRDCWADLLDLQARLRG